MCSPVCLLALTNAHFCAGIINYHKIVMIERSDRSNAKENIMYVHFFYQRARESYSFQNVAFPIKSPNWLNNLAI